MKSLFNRKTFWAAVAALVGVLVLVLVYRHPWGQSSPFYTTQVKRGNLVISISATGTVEPEEVIDVGAQVAGRIVVFGKDRNGKTIDYGSEVEAGMVLARIDDALYAADAEQARAVLEQTKAGVIRAEADLDQQDAKLFQAKREWERAQKLGPSEALAQSDYDAAQSDNEVAEANVAVSKAAIVQAKKTVAQAEATLKRAEQNLDYCTIRSPVRGIIIDRRVNIGQTVVASLNAPSLFLIAKDLKRLQVWVPVNEADIGNIHPGQPVTFTVDAYPGYIFHGEVGKTRLNAAMTQNVVTYTVEVITDNSEGKLLPYLTANVKFILSHRTNVLFIPNTALRWAPRPELIAGAYKGGAKTTPEDVPSPTTQPRIEEHRRNRGTSTIWLPQGNFVKPLSVYLGPSDGSMTEIQGREIQEGIEVVVGEQRKEEALAPVPGASPFVTPSPRAMRQRQSRQ